MSKGILYIAFNEAYIKEAFLSAESLKRYMPEMPVALITNKEVSSPFIDQVIIKKIKHARSKVDLVSETPFEKTIYLDSDTLIVRDISDMFEVLDRFDVAFTHDYARKRKKYSDVIPEYSEIPYSFSEVNGGIMAYNNSQRTVDFLELWKKYFYKYYNQTNGWDQVSLRISLWKSEASIHHFPFEYNIRSKANREKQDRFKHQFGEGHMSPRIYHMHHNPNVYKGKFTVNNLEELEKSLKEQAVWY
tara:strand:- start:132 stop:869 length:738 start_codon:yes stop_codon:yes gene_type:complete